MERFVVQMKLFDRMNKILQDEFAYDTGCIWPILKNPVHPVETSVV